MVPSRHSVLLHLTSCLCTFPRPYPNHQHAPSHVLTYVHVQSHPEEVRSKLESFLSSNSIAYSYSKTTKFGERGWFVCVCWRREVGWVALCRNEGRLEVRSCMLSSAGAGLT